LNVTNEGFSLGASPYATKDVTRILLVHSLQHVKQLLFSGSLQLELLVPASDLAGLSLTIAAVSVAADAGAATWSHTITLSSGQTKGEQQRAVGEDSPSTYVFGIPHTR
jgi:ribosomal protein L32